MSISAGRKRRVFCAFGVLVRLCGGVVGLALSTACVSSGGGSGGGDRDGDSAGATSRRVSDGSVARLMRVLTHHNTGTDGSGSLVAVVDTGVVQGLRDFGDRISALSLHLLKGSDDFEDVAGHGTKMAGIIAADGSGSGVVGMAPGSELLILRADTNDDPGVPYSGRVATGIRYAADNGADVINLSLTTGSTVVSDAIQYAVDMGSIVVMATGNSGKDSEPSGIAQRVGTYGPTALAVTAVNDDNEIASYAAPCNVADPTYCVAAPGNNIGTIDLEGEPATVSGTSAATAVVSGGIALMRQYFPDLTAAEIVEILLATTLDLGEAGVDAIYGSGLVDFTAALRPLGDITLSSVDNETPVQASTAEASGAFGDTLTESATLAAMPIEDAYGRDYLADLGQVLNPRLPQLEDVDLLADLRASSAGFDTPGLSFSYQRLGDSPVTKRIEDDWRFALTLQPDGRDRFSFSAAQGRTDLDPDRYHFQLVKSDPVARLAPVDLTHQMSLAYQRVTEWGQVGSQVALKTDIDDRRTTSVTLSYVTPEVGGVRFNASLSALHEEGSVLGARFSGAFGEIRAGKSAMATLGATYEGDGWDAFVSGSLGRATVSMADRGLFTDFEGIGFSTWAAGVGWGGVLRAGDRVSVGIGQPVRVTSGRARLFDDSTQSLRPSGRELNLEFAYRAQVAETDFAASLVYGHEVGNIAGAPAQLSAAIGLVKRF